MLLILLFLLPSQLAYHFWPTSAFVFGIRVDYLAPTVYLTDILIIFLALIEFKIFKKYVWLFGFVIILGLLNTIFSILPPASLFRWIKILEAIVLAVYIANQRVVMINKIYRTLFYSAVFFSIIGIFQFFTGSAFGKIFYIFGERSFNLSTPGVALTSIWGRQFLRAYSTFSHPNSLAGYFGIVVILTSTLRYGRGWHILGYLLIVFGFILTFSVSAFGAMIFIYFLYLIAKRSRIFKKLCLYLFGLIVLISLTFPILSISLLSSLSNLPQNLLQRVDLAIVSGKMISQKFLLGEGLNTFVFAATKLKGAVYYSWLMQPVHNIFLLVCSEVGIIGLLLLSLLLYKQISRDVAQKNTTLVLCLVFILITGAVDHYWLTLQQNVLLFSIISGLSFRVVSRKNYR